MEVNIRPKIRIMMIAFIIFFLYAVICIRLWSIQVRGRDEIQSRMIRQYVRRIRIPAVRGRIFSSDGVLLAGNSASCDIMFHISEMRRPGPRQRTVEYVYSEAERLAALLGRENHLTREKIQKHMIHYPGLPVTVLKELNREELAKCYEIVPAIPGMEIVTNMQRTYPQGKIAGHLVGYVGRADPRNSEDFSDYSYYIPDIVGRSGLERVCDTWNSLLPPSVRNDETSGSQPEIPPEKRPLLRGLAGKELVTVDTFGFVRETIGVGVPAENGKDLTLTIDFKAQKTAERLLKGLCGAIVLLDASSGKVLAMASSPSYDPSVFVPRIRKSVYDALRLDPQKPLFNRATLGMYMPGSIVKPLVSIALLESDPSAENIVYCDGLTKIGTDSIACWNRSGHGEVSLVDALAVSCNDFFVESGIKLGLERLASVYSGAGIGSKTGFILPEGAGRLPDRSHKRKWNSFDTGLISIGQGDILVTPLQAALYAAAIANGGTLWKPQIIQEVKDAKGMVLYQEQPESRGKLPASPKTLETVRNGMFLAVNSDLGGANRARNNSIQLSGKTGTAEVKIRDNTKNTWFIGYGTRDDVTYAIAVLVENGVSGGKTCAPIAAKFFKEYFDENTEDEES